MVAGIGGIGERRAGQTDLLLRRALTGNALFSLVSGLVMVGASGWVNEKTGLEPAWAPAAIGAGVLAWAGGVALLARSDALVPPRVWPVIAGDLLWVAVSYGVLITGVPALTTAGAWSVGILAEIVAVLAVIQYFGLRRLQP